MKTLTIRGIEPELADKINEWAKKSGKSINQASLRLLKSALGLGDKKNFPVFHDLDPLAGTWSHEDETLFFKSIQIMSQVDPEMWK